MAGTTGKVIVDGGEDEEGVSTEAQGRAVLEALGEQRRNEVSLSPSIGKTAPWPRLHTRISNVTRVACQHAAAGSWELTGWPCCCQ